MEGSKRAMDNEKYLDVSALQAEEIANLKQQLARLQGRNPSIEEATKPWPKVETVYLHSNKESMRDLGERIGLAEKDIQKFKFLFYEVAIKLEINEDGTYKILEHDLK